MDKNDSTLNLLSKSMLGILVIYLFVGTSSAICSMNEMSQTGTRITQGIAVWLAAIVLIIYQKYKKRPMEELGLCKVSKEGLKHSYYCIPMIIVAALPYIEGPHEGGIPYFLASFFMALGVGLEEELYFRGYVFNVWKSKPEKTAIIATSLIFGVTHMANLMAGQSFFDTVLQVVFAFVYGIIFILMYILGKSLWPCIILHFYHDFSSFVSDETKMTLEYKIGVVQLIIMIIYMIMLIRQYRKQQSSDKK